jgi:plasmid stabilization system protein ParE
MAYTAIVYLYRQDAEDDLEQIYTYRTTFGPFDSWEDVRAWCDSHFHDPSVYSA